MNKIRLIDGYNDRKNIEYYRNYTIKTRDFLQDENLSNIEKVQPYWNNSTDKFEYDYYTATWYDVDNNDYDIIYFCIQKERYIITTENDIYIYYRDDTVNVLCDKNYKEMYITDISIGDYIDVFLDNNNYELVTDISID